MKGLVRYSLLAGMLLVPLLAPGPAAAISGAAACTTSAYGRNYALNTSAFWHPTAKEWVLSTVHWQYASSDPDDEVQTRKNNIVIELKQDPDTVVWAYVSPDNQQYGQPYFQETVLGTARVLRTEGGRVVSYAAFDRPGNPDPHCTAVIHLDGPNGICVTCPIEG